MIQHSFWTYPSSKIVWRITQARKVVNDYSAEEAARARYDVLKTSRDLPTADPRVEDFLEQAKSVEDNPGTPVKEPRFALLVALELRACLRRGRTQKHAALAKTILAKVGNPAIPTDDARFVALVEDAIRAVADGAKSVSAARARTNMLRRMFRQMAAWSLAFKPYGKLVGLVMPRFDSVQSDITAAATKPASRPPFSKSEILSHLGELECWEQVLLFIAYLSLGTRPGDCDQAHYDHIVAGAYHLDEIQSKRKTGKRPVAPLVLCAMLRYVREKELLLARLPKGIWQQRFRPTTGVMLTLSGVDPLTVSTRLGHTNTLMIIKHYCKFFPTDYGNTKDAWRYFGAERVKVDGFSTAENAYDNWLLFLLLTSAKRFDKLTAVKEAVVAEILNASADNVVPLDVASF